MWKLSPWFSALSCFAFQAENYCRKTILVLDQARRQQAAFSQPRVPISKHSSIKLQLDGLRALPFANAHDRRVNLDRHVPGELHPLLRFCPASDGNGTVGRDSPGRCRTRSVPNGSPLGIGSAVVLSPRWPYGRSDPGGSRSYSSGSEANAVIHHFTALQASQVQDL